MQMIAYFFLVIIVPPAAINKAVARGIRKNKNKNKKRT